MHIKKLLSHLNEDSQYSTRAEQSNLYRSRGKSTKTIEEFEQNIKTVEPHFFMTQEQVMEIFKRRNKQVPRNSMEYQKSVAGGFWRREKEFKTPIPSHAYPFYSETRKFFRSRVETDIRTTRYFKVFVNTAARGKDPFAINAVDSKNFYTIVQKVVNFHENPKSSENSALQFLLENYKNFINAGADEEAFKKLKSGEKDVGEKESEEVEDFEKEKSKDSEDSEEFILKFKDGEEITKREVKRIISTFFESRIINIFELDLSSDLKQAKMKDDDATRNQKGNIRFYFDKWFREVLIPGNTKEAIDKFIPEKKKIKKGFVDWAAKNTRIDHKDLENFLMGNDDPTDFEKDKPKEEPKASKEFESLKQELKKKGYEFDDESDKLLNSLIDNYPEKEMTADIMKVSFSLLDKNVPDSTNITISGTKFTKKELKKILNSMSESILESLKYELIEYKAAPRIKELIDLIRGGKTKEDLLSGDHKKKDGDEEEDFKGIAAQVNRIKKRALRSPQRQINIGKKLRDMLDKMEVPTAKLKTREDLKNLGSGSFDSIIKGLQNKKEGENDVKTTRNN